MMYVIYRMVINVNTLYVYMTIVCIDIASMTFDCFLFLFLGRSLSPVQWREKLIHANYWECDAPVEIKNVFFSPGEPTLFI